MKPSLLIKRFFVILSHANKVTIFLPFPRCPSSKRQKLSRLLNVDVFHKIMHKELLYKWQLTVMEKII